MDVDLTIRYSDERRCEIVASRPDTAAPLYRIVSRRARPRLEPHRDNAGSTPPLRNQPVGEAPNDDDARQSLDCAVQTKGDERDQSYKDASNDANRALDPEPQERERRQQLGASREAQPC